LNALVSRIVCAVGFRDAVDAAFLLLVAGLLLFLLLPALVGLVSLRVVFPADAVLLLAAGFFVCSVAVADVCAHPMVLPPAKDAANATKAPNATPVRTLSQMLIMISLLLRPTHPL
jgi:hypothetical protein